MKLLSIVVFVLWICGSVLWVCRSSLWVCRSVDFVLQESKFSVWSLYFGRNQSRPPPIRARFDSTGGFWQSAAGLELLHPFRSGRLRVGHKPDPDRPVDNPTLCNEIILLLYSLPFFHLSHPCVDRITNFLDTCPISTFLKYLGAAIRLGSMFRYYLRINAVSWFGAKYLMR